MLRVVLITFTITLTDVESKNKISTIFGICQTIFRYVFLVTLKQNHSFHLSNDDILLGNFHKHDFLVFPRRLKITNHLDQ